MLCFFGGVGGIGLMLVSGLALVLGACWWCWCWFGVGVGLCGCWVGVVGDL